MPAEFGVEVYHTGEDKGDKSNFSTVFSLAIYHVWENGIYPYVLLFAFNRLGC